MLNKTGFQSTAAIVAEIQDTGPSNATQRRRDHSPFYTLQISNCDRSMSWELDGFGYWSDDDGQTKAAMENDLHKLDVMIDALTQFREGVELEQKRYLRRKGR